MRKITSNPTFEIRDWSPGMIALIATETYDPPIKGLPPIKTHSIVFEIEDLDNLLKVLNDYADKRRNS